VGKRIESREIELALLKIPAITDAVVRPFPGTNGTIIVAYLVAKNGGLPNKNQIRRQLSRLLPSYMIPNQLLQLESIPKTRTGKIAYDQLPSAIVAPMPLTSAQVD
jgi:iturin family lipopeptide synthetase C